ncbi:RNA elimination defective protein Red1 [Peltigera leucophlebia]|nr:RNA elimination defective protein Red1 [Peltigera leucophlebia]
MATEKFVLITGCGNGGIGHALAQVFRAKGFTVFATLLPHESRKHLLQHNIHVFDADVTKDEDTSALKKQVEAVTQGRLDILVNNAGICYTMTAADTEIKEVEKMFAVNVFGPMRMVRFFHPMLVAAKGTVVNIGSIGGIVPYVYGAASYNASKAALHHYGNTLRVEMKPLGVRVVNIISGEVGTNILQKDSNRKLPASSLYISLEEDFAAHVRRIPVTITPKDYASAVVQEVTKKAPSAWFWYGAQTFTVRWCDALLPRTFWDWLFIRMFSLNKLTNKTT